LNFDFEAEGTPWFSSKLPIWPTRGGQNLKKIVHLASKKIQSISNDKKNQIKISLLFNSPTTTRQKK
jgi:hypothetical protein